MAKRLIRERALREAVEIFKKQNSDGEEASQDKRYDENLLKEWMGISAQVPMDEMPEFIYDLVYESDEVLDKRMRERFENLTGEPNETLTLIKMQAAQSHLDNAGELLLEASFIINNMSRENGVEV